MSTTVLTDLRRATALLEAVRCVVEHMPLTRMSGVPEVIADIARTVRVTGPAVFTAQQALRSAQAARVLRGATTVGPGWMELSATLFDAISLLETRRGAVATTTAVDERLR